MENRIEYVDKLKGFAITLVVMGHILEKGLGINEMPINLFYKSFHMPLFMFLSGLFAMKGLQKYSLAECLGFVKRKSLRILLPFFTVGGIYAYLHYGSFFPILTGECRNYWFLPALFFCMITEMIMGIFGNVAKLNSALLDLLYHVILFLLLSFIYMKCGNVVPYYLHFVKMYPFLVMGVFFSKYQPFRNSVVKSQYLLSIALILYVLTIAYSGKIDAPVILPAFFAIIILVQLFSKGSTPPVMSLVGRSSLQIYVFHWFFLPSLIPLGNEIVNLEISADIIDNSNFVLLFFISLFLSIPIIGVCLIIEKVVKQSYWLNLLFFGGK